MTRPRLTHKQKRLLDFLVRQMNTRQTAPSLREAADALSISHAAVAQTLKTLEKKGYVRREGRYSRTLHLLDPGGSSSALQHQKQVPVIGEITAGLPMYAQQEWAGTVLVDARIYPGPDLFALEVKGDSMTRAGILDRDLAICTPRQYARDKEIVVALVRNEDATVKRFFLHSDHIELRPENPAYSPQFYGFDEVLIQGKVLGIIRGPGREWQP